MLSLIYESYQNTFILLREVFIFVMFNSVFRCGSFLIVACWLLAWLVLALLLLFIQRLNLLFVLIKPYSVILFLTLKSVKSNLLSIIYLLKQSNPKLAFSRLNNHRIGLLLLRLFIYCPFNERSPPNNRIWAFLALKSSNLAFYSRRSHPLLLSL